MSDLPADAHAKMPGPWAEHPDRGCVNPPPGWTRRQWVNLWFPERGELTTAAQEICAACPVQQDCLDYALTTVQKNGIWGGRSERQRRRMRRHLNTTRRTA